MIEGGKEMGVGMPEEETKAKSMGKARPAEEVGKEREGKREVEDG